jgi:hypothetical protein
LEAAAILDLHNGDSGVAVTNILTLVTLIHNNASEGLLISYMVRMAMTGIAILPTWELLQATNVTDAQLASVQNGWERLDLLSDAGYAFAIERALSSADFQAIRTSHEKFHNMTAGPMAAYLSSSTSAGGGTPSCWETMTQGARNAIGEVMWRSSWSYSDEWRMIKSDQIILEAVRSMQTNSSQNYKLDHDAMMSRLASLGITNAGEAFFRELKIPDFQEELGDFGLDHTVRQTLRYEAARRIMITAVALKRFQLKHGKWPDALDELAPEFLASVLIDPYDGKPLKYHPNTDGTFLLYGVGEDGIDDGGDPTNSGSAYPFNSWNDFKSRDWVWPQPASAAEVQNFYEHPPK